MKIDKLNSWQRDLKTMRILVISVVLGCLGLVGFMYHQNLVFLENKSKTVVLVDQDNNTLLATEMPITRGQRMAQIQNHVEDFYELFFEFDSENFNERIDAALRLIGEDGAELYQEYYITSTFERSIKEKNWVLFVDVESVEIDMNSYPYKGVAKAKQTLETKSTRTTRNLYAEFAVRNTEVSYNNPVGCLIEGFRLVNNEVTNKESLTR